MKYILFILMLACSMAFPKKAGAQETDDRYIKAQFSLPAREAFPQEVQPGDYYLAKLRETIAPHPGIEWMRSLSGRHGIVAFPRGILPQEEQQRLFEFVLPAHSNWKLSPRLFIQPVKKEGKSAFSIVVRDQEAFREMIRTQNLPVSVIRQYAPAGVIVLAAPEKVFFDRILHSPLVLFADRADRMPREELSVEGLDLSVNAVTPVHARFPEWNGKGLTVSVKENLFDTTDIDFLGRYVPSPVSAEQIARHASIMSTIIAGGGNSSSTGKGIAWAAQLTPSDFLSLLPDDHDIYRSLGVSVQNHSYGVAIENFYGADALAYDRSVEQLPFLVHIFSSGNDGDQTSESGPYAGIEGWGNLTGSFKMAKNIITVGSIDGEGIIPDRSSKGPAYDGRIKPELVAYALDGSSGAAAVVSGISLLIQQAFRASHGGQLPSAALVKAILLNSADDIGPEGPDFRSGFGNANAWKALHTVQNSRHLSGTLTQNETRTLRISVPAKAQNLKITLAWIDPAATANAVPALKNDLDLDLSRPSDNQHWKPWTLSTFPHPDSLAAPARRGRDSLNNVEQITVPAPTPGEYEIRVSGRRSLSEAQAFEIAYDWDTAGHFQWVFPTTGSVAEPDKALFLRWLAAPPFSIARLEYALHGSENWLPIADGIDPASGRFQWKAPDTLAIGQVRLVMEDRVYTSGLFSIAPSISPRVGFNCPDSVLLFWPPVPEAEGYVLYTPGERYLQEVATSNDTFIILPKAPFPFSVFSIGPVLPDFGTLPPGPVIDYTLQGVECYLKTFLADPLGTDQARLRLFLGTTYQIKKIDFEKRINGSFQPIRSVEPKAETFFEYIDPALVKGVNTYRARIGLADGSAILSEPLDIFFLPSDTPYLLFPNPVRSGQLLFLLAQKLEGAEFFLADQLGRPVLHQPIVGIPQEFDLSALPAGIYFFFIRKNGVVREKGKLVLRN